jgi:hypothetical protein
VKVSLLVLALIAAAPGAVLAQPGTVPGAPPPSAPPPAAAPPASAPLYGPPYAPAPAPPAPAAPAPAPPAHSSLGPPSEAAPPAAPAAAPGPPGDERSPPRDEKSPLIAFSLSFAVPIAVVAGSVNLLDPDEGAGAWGVTIGAIALPSMGWFYAGRPLYGLATTGTRLAGFALAIRVLDDSATAGGDEGVILFGAALIAASTLVDWIGAPLAVARDNARARAAVVPAVHAGGGGLSIVGAF